MADKTAGLRTYAKAKNERSRRKALSAIKKMIKDGKKLTIYGIHKESGCARSFLYNDPVVRQEIEKYRHQKPQKSDESKTVTIKALQMENARLKQRLKYITDENGETWKQKYRKLQDENEELRRQLKSIYSDIKHPRSVNV